MAVGQLIDGAMQPGQFFVAPPLKLTWSATRAETIAWEIFRGRLLDRKQTREQKTFLSWHIGEDGAEEATIGVHLDVHARQIHVTRGLLCHVHEACDIDGGIDSREAIRWTRELVGTLSLSDFADLEEVRDELICLLWQAVVGTSRLPLTSAEAPLPAFAFGQLHFVFLADSEESKAPCTSWQTWLRRGLRPGLAWREHVKLLEFALRRIEPAQLPELTELFLASAVALPLPRLLRSLFNDVSLSPYTGFVDNTLAWVNLLCVRGAWSSGAKIDFLGHLLRQLGRHLTAYDLVTFHQRGANYPDALLLDRLLKEYAREIDAQPALFTGDQARLRRRALRQGCLLRRHYEGHRVPDLPTSPGENARVMPASHPRVSEEQITQPLRRRRQLFADDPLMAILSEKGRRVLQESIRDVEHPDERAELGLGVFIDRPLGYGKAAAEPDVTPLLAHEAFSPSIARRRWQELQRLAGELQISVDCARLQVPFDGGPWPTGLAHADLVECPRPAAALADVRRVADDFIIVRTLPGGLAECFDLRELAVRFRLRFLAEGTPRLCVQTWGPVIALFDAECRRRVEMTVDQRQGYRCRAGVEQRAAGCGFWWSGRIRTIPPCWRGGTWMTWCFEDHGSTPATSRRVSKNPKRPLGP